LTKHKLRHKLQQKWQLWKQKASSSCSKRLPLNAKSRNLCAPSYPR